MSYILIPFALAFLAILAGFSAYRSIQRGNARYYALEREHILRRAGFTLLASMALFVATVGILFWQQQRLLAPSDDEIAAEGTPEATVVTDLSALDTLPPTASPVPTIDPAIPTLTPTPFLRKGIIGETGGSGAYLRDRPTTGAEEVQILDDGEIVILLDSEEPVQANGYTWLKVRTNIGGQEGWVADIFLTVSER